MIVIKIEMWPQGQKEKAYEYGLIVIANDGTGASNAGNYDAAIAHTGPHVGKPGCYRAGRVENFRRLDLNVYHLIHQALGSCLANYATKRGRELISHARTGKPASPETLFESEPK